jgi:hypothetical protein
MPRSTRRKIFAAIGVLALVAVAGVVGSRLMFPLHRDPPAVMGTELDSGGAVRRRMVRERSRRVTGWMPDPHGGGPTRVYYDHYFLEVPGRPRQELPFLASHLPGNVTPTDLCLPVRNSPLWVAAGYFYPGHQIDVVVFDPSAVRTHQRIEVASDDNHPGNDFRFENGNQILKYRTPDGEGAYDVRADRFLK